MKKEISAGGLVVRNRKGIWQVLLIRDMKGIWTFPKGMVETGEELPVTAKREIGEEVGLTDIEIIEKISAVNYQYRRNGLVAKTVHYFLFKQSGNQKTVCQREEGISEARWFTLDEASREVGYPETNIPLVEKAAALLIKYKNP